MSVPVHDGLVAALRRILPVRKPFQPGNICLLAQCNGSPMESVFARRKPPKPRTQGLELTCLKVTEEGSGGPRILQPGSGNRLLVTGRNTADPWLNFSVKCLALNSAGQTRNISNGFSRGTRFTRKGFFQSGFV